MRYALFTLALALAGCSLLTGDGDGGDAGAVDTSTDSVPGDDTCVASAEICDGVDNDCNGLIDDGAPGIATFYLDDDGDGYGADASLVRRCEEPDGYVTRGGDCDDGDGRVFPGATERCDGVDDNCDDVIDDDAICATGSCLDGTCQ